MKYISKSLIYIGIIILFSINVFGLARIADKLNVTGNVTFNKITMCEVLTTDANGDIACGFNTIDSNASTGCSDGRYLDGDGSCILFNDTVAKLFAGQQIILNATNISVEVGTLTSGNVTSTWKLADNQSLNVTEVTGTPGFLININFTNVTSFNQVALRGKYIGGAGHTLAIEIFRVGVDWEERAEITDQMDFGVTTFPVFIGANFIDGDGKVQIRINHDDNGISNHEYSLDAIFIGQVPGLVTGGDLADLTGRDEACTLLPDVFCKDGSKNFTGNIFAPALSIIAGWFNGSWNGSIILEGLINGLNTTTAKKADDQTFTGENNFENNVRFLANVTLETANTLKINESLELIQRLTGVIGAVINATGISYFNGGNVGIGTPTPNFKLEINAADDALNVSDFLFVNSTNVGIGTNILNHALDINGNLSVQKGYIFGAGGEWISISGRVGNTIDFQVGGESITFSDGGVNPIIFCPTGICIIEDTMRIGSTANGLDISIDGRLSDQNDAFVGFTEAINVIGTITSSAGMILTNDDDSLTFDGGGSSLSHLSAQNALVLISDDNVAARLGDAVGAFNFAVVDSGGTPVMTVSSVGALVSGSLTANGNLIANSNTLGTSEAIALVATGNTVCTSGRIMYGVRTSSGSATHILCAEI